MAHPSTSYRIPDTLKAQIKKAAHAEEIGQQELVIKAIREYLERKYGTREAAK